MLTATIPQGMTFVQASGGIYSATLGGMDALGIYWLGDVPSNTTYAMTLTVQVTHTQATSPFRSFGRASISGEEIAFRRLDVEVIGVSTGVTYTTFLPLVQR